LRCLQFPYSIGIIGGRPRSSLYFIGAQDDRVFYLDPHTVQATLPLAHDFTTHSETYHSATVASMSASNIDPSLAIGFSCRNPSEFAHFWQLSKQMVDTYKLSVFNVADVAPNYGEVSVLADSDDEGIAPKNASPAITTGPHNAGTSAAVATATASTKQTTLSAAGVPAAATPTAIPIPTPTPPSSAKLDVTPPAPSSSPPNTELKVMGASNGATKSPHKQTDSDYDEIRDIAGGSIPDDPTDDFVIL